MLNVVMALAVLVLFVTLFAKTADRKPTCYVVN